MGIRYYAYPVPARDVAAARLDPITHLSDDPLADAWELGRQRPEMLYLDKCWRMLQSLTCRGGERRPAHALFEGQVRFLPEYNYLAHEPWIKVLDPEEVRAIDDDLQTMDESDVDLLLSDGDYSPRFDNEGRYILEYLRAAQHFTATMRQRGDGLIYTIG